MFTNLVTRNAETVASLSDEQLREMVRTDASRLLEIFPSIERGNESEVRSLANRVISLSLNDLLRANYETLQSIRPLIESFVSNITVTSDNWKNLYILGKKLDLHKLQQTVVEAYFSLYQPELNPPNDAEFLLFSQTGWVPTPEDEALFSQAGFIVSDEVRTRPDLIEGARIGPQISSYIQDRINPFKQLLWEHGGIEELDLSKVCSENIRTMMELPSLMEALSECSPNLRSIVLKGITENQDCLDQAIELTVALLPNLQRLNVGDIQDLSDNHLRMIAERCRNLTHLNLSGIEKINDSRLEILALGLERGEGLTNLTYLDISNCSQLTEACLNTISRFPNLQHVITTGTSIPNAERTAASQ